MGDSASELALVGGVAMVAIKAVVDVVRHLRARRGEEQSRQAEATAIALIQQDITTIKNHLNEIRHMRETVNTLVAKAGVYEYRIGELDRMMHDLQSRMRAVERDDN